MLLNCHLQEEGYKIWQLLENQNTVSIKIYLVTVFLVLNLILDQVIM